MTSPAELDIITIGRSSIDLYGAELGVDLSDVAMFTKSIGGSPTNIAVGAARLGLRSAVLTRVGDEQMGTAVIDTLGREGVDTSAIRRDPERLTALVLLAVQDQSTTPHIFFRRDCADMALSEDDVDPTFIRRARAIVVTGTHFSNATVAKASWKAIEIARTKGARVVFDIDFRPSLWGLAPHAGGSERIALAPRVAESLSAVMEASDVVVGTEEEFCSALNQSDVDAALREARSRTAAALICKRGAAGCDVYPGGAPGVLEVPTQGARFAVDVVNTIGAGDAFISGFLKGYLDGADWETCATFANACGAIAVSRLLCSQDYPTWPELERFLEAARRNRPATAEIAELHRATTRRPIDGDLFILACDHRTQFRDIADRYGFGYERLPAFKRLAVAAAVEAKAQDRKTGVILDDEYGAEALFDAAKARVWCGRPVEIAGSRPIEFVTGPDVGSGLLAWPRSQTVKCLCYYDPADAVDLRRQQEGSLGRVFQACLRTGHEFLLEIIPPDRAEDRSAVVSAAIRRLYELDIRPDWWKLEPFAEHCSWERVTQAVQDNDPLCRGILILGQTASLEALQSAFAASSLFDIVRGFAIGRAIVASPFEAWLRREIDDQKAVASMRETLARLIDAWRATRVGARETA